MELRDFISEAAKETDLIHALTNQPVSDEQQEAIDTAPTLKDKVIAVLKTVHDPEIPVNIWDLGLVYAIDTSYHDDGASNGVDKDNKADTKQSPAAAHHKDSDAIITVSMTLTAPTCPVAGAIPQEVKSRIATLIPDHHQINVNLVWTPAWNKDMMSEEAQLLLDLW